MFYRVFVRYGGDSEKFYFKNRQQANWAYNVLVESGFFSYVALEVVTEKTFLQKEWSDPENDEL